MQLRRLYVHSPRQKKNVKRPPTLHFDSGRPVLPMCNGKVCYDRETAKLVKRKQEHRSGTALRTYPHSCGYWHLTKRLKSKPPASVRNKSKFTSFTKDYGNIERRIHPSDHG